MKHQDGAYTTETLSLRGGDAATLISRAATGQPQGAILYLHGFVDYFFHDHLAEHLCNRGWSFYAIELRRYGRSIRDGETPWETRDLTEYYEELDQAIQRIRADGHQWIVLMGHSTGGLISTIWAYDRKKSHPIDGLILNSPWLDLQEGWLQRTLGTWVIRAVGVVKPDAIIPQELSGVYPQSIHQSAHGEWDFDTSLKPLTGQPVTFGFLATVRREQARLHKGMDVGVPVLLLRSAESRLGLASWNESAQTADVVLDVQQMHLWLPKLGRLTTEVVLQDAVHDVMLSAKPVRDQAMRSIDTWLAGIDSSESMAPE